MNGLEHNLLSVGQLVDKGYQLQFTEKSCIIKDKDGSFIFNGTRTRCNVFQLNPTEMTCFVAKVDDGWLWHKRFCHINFDNIVKVNTTFATGDLLKIVKPTNMMCKECMM